MRQAALFDEEEFASLFRAVGLNEAADIRDFGGFRPSPSGHSIEDKWFATNHDDAVAFGRLLQRLLSRPRRFVVAEVVVPAPFLLALHYNPRIDRIGPAYLVRSDQLPELNRIGRVIVHGTRHARLVSNRSRRGGGSMG